MSQKAEALNVTIPERKEAVQADDSEKHRSNAEEDLKQIPGEGEEVTSPPKQPILSPSRLRSRHFERRRSVLEDEGLDSPGPAVVEVTETEN